jgi:hypothetical protein
MTALLEAPDHVRLAARDRDRQHLALGVLNSTTKVPGVLTV